MILTCEQLREHCEGSIIIAIFLQAATSLVLLGLITHCSRAIGES